VRLPEIGRDQLAKANLHDIVLDRSQLSAQHIAHFVQVDPCRSDETKDEFDIRWVRGIDAFNDSLYAACVSCPTLCTRRAASPRLITHRRPSCCH